MRESRRTWLQAAEVRAYDQLHHLSVYRMDEGRAASHEYSKYAERGFGGESGCVSDKSRARCVSSTNGIVAMQCLDPGFTRRLYNELRASSTTSIPTYLDGPYGTSEDLSHHSTVLLIAGELPIPLEVAQTTRIVSCRKADIQVEPVLPTSSHTLSTSYPCPAPVLPAQQ
jgi:hypothetical protein